jgi:hypothetical protein
VVRVAALVGRSNAPLTSIYSQRARTAEEVMNDGNERIDAVEARVTALAAIVKGALTTLIVRGLLNKASIDEMLKETAEVMRAHGTHRAALDELDALRGDLPKYLRAAMGPGPDPDFEDH